MLPGAGINICHGSPPQVTPQGMSLSPATRFLIAATLLAGCCACLNAQSTQDVSSSEVQDLSIKGPQADSPFFIERQEAQAALADEGREGYGMYAPKPPHPPVQQQVKKFFTGMFASVKLLGNGQMLPMLITVDPSDFSVAEHPDLTITLRVSNSKRQEIEFLFPNDQRLEIVTKDSTGTVVNRWSEDRTFDPTEGFSEINPEEFIVYSEKISTTAMKAGETYTIEASLAGQKGYTTSTTVTPTP
jgi:outer membrane murein-binding lipoprotein Lpp